MPYPTRYNYVQVEKYNTPLKVYGLVNGKTAQQIADNCTCSDVRSMTEVLGLEYNSCLSKSKAASKILIRLYDMKKSGELYLV